MSARQAKNHPFFTDASLPPACNPLELGIIDIKEDYHEFVTKSERNKKTDFKKTVTFKHNREGCTGEAQSFSLDKKEGLTLQTKKTDKNEPTFWKASSFAAPEKKPFVEP